MGVVLCPDFGVVRLVAVSGVAEVRAKCDWTSPYVPATSLSPTDHTSQGRCTRASGGGVAPSPSEEQHGHVQRGHSEAEVVRKNTINRAYIL